MMISSKEKTDFSFNPFVGPHALETGRNIFGRDQEIDDLYYLLNAERIVMLHSPSGAGKTSLIQAGLIPRLNKRFDVWGRARVNKSPSPNSPANVNRYILSAVLDFEQQIPAERRRTEDQLIRELAGKTLADYVANRPRRSSAPQNIVLFFDQFEEILTTDPLAIDAKREFFKQVGELLLDPSIWALFAMREDYLPALDPYAEQLPTHLKNWFRIDLLRRDKAAEAIIKTAEEGGRHFVEEKVSKLAVVDALVSDLATIKVQQPDGNFFDQTGLYVEPLQLQVVCRQLWERMPADKQIIDRTDIEKSGEVNKALSDYYAAEVKKLANGNERTERKLRDWVGKQLITSDGIRSQVRRGTGSSEGLDNELIAGLVNTHLVRSEQRENAIWYELAHDRLIKPVLDNNRAWSGTHLHKVQKLALLWGEHDNPPPSLLLLGTDLIEAQQWAIQNEVTDESIEGKFLKASAAKQEEIEKEKRQARRLRLMLAAVVVVALLALIAAGTAVVSFYNANRQKEIAEKQKIEADLAKQDAIRQKIKSEENLQKAKEQTLIAQRQTKIAEYETLKASIAKAKAEEAEAKAISRELASHSASLLRSDPELSLIIAYKGMQLSQTTQAEDALRQALVQSGYLNFLEGGKDTVRKFIFSPDGKLLFTLSSTNRAQGWDAVTGKSHKTFGGIREKISEVTFSPNGKLFVTSSTSETATAWDVATGKSLYSLADGKAVGHVTFSPDGRLLVTCNLNGPARAWDAATGKPLYSFGDAGEAIGRVTFSPDGKLLVTRNGFVGPEKIWDADTGKKLFVIRDADELLDSEFSPDGKLLVIRSYTRQTRVLVAATGKPLYAVVNKGFKFSPDSKLFVTSSSTGSARAWDAATGKPMYSLGGAGEAIWDVTFSPDGKLLITLTSSGQSRALDATTGKPMYTFGGIGEKIQRVTFSPNGKLLVACNLNGPARAWDASTGKPLYSFGGAGEGNLSITFRSDSKLFSTLTTTGNLPISSGPARVWDAATGSELFVVGSALERINNATFSPDGTLFITTSEKYKFQFHSIDMLTKLSSIEVLKKVARKALPRGLTPEEREKYLHEPRSKGK